MPTRLGTAPVRPPTVAVESFQEGPTMRLSMIGCGSLGTVHAAAMASIGHDVVGIDVDQRKIDTLSQGKAPFF